MATPYPIYFSDQAPDGMVPAIPVQASSVRTSPTLVRSFRNRWPLALGVGSLLGFVAAATTWSIIPAKYTASSSFRVSTWEPAVLDNKHSLPPQERTIYQKTQAALVTSEQVLKAALKNEKVLALNNRALGVLWLQEHLHVGFIEDTDILTVSLSSPDAKEAATLVNAVVDTYMTKIVDEEKAQQSKRMGELDTIYRDTKTALQTKKQELEKDAIELKTSDSTALTIKQKNSLEEYGALRKEMAKLRSELMAAQLKLSLQQIGASPDGKQVSVESLVEELLDADPVIRAEMLQVREAERIFEKTKSVSQPGTVAMARAELKIKQVRDSMEEVRQSRRPIIRKRLMDRVGGEANGSLRKAQEEVAILQNQLGEMKKEEETLKSSVEQIGMHSYVLEMKKGEIEQEEQVLRALLGEMERLNIEKKSAIGRITGHQRADVPEEKIYTAKIQGTAFAGFCGLFLGAWVVSFRENRMRRIRSTQEITDLGIRVVGTLPNLPNRNRLAGLQTNDTPRPYWGNVLAESITYLRTRLLHESKEHHKQLFMIASAMPEEGKTMIAGHLAISIAQTGRKTLIIDGDLRRPILGNLFNGSVSSGLCEVLRGEARLEDVIYTTPIEGLSLLPAGSCSKEILQTLCHDTFRELFGKLRGDFDFIIVDSCPLLPVSDGLLLGKLMDAVVLCIRPGVSEIPSVLAAYERLRGLNIPVEGVVINGDRRAFKAMGYQRYLGSEMVTT